MRAPAIGLRMTDCRLEDFPAQALSYLTNLTFLFIGNNAFTHLPPGAFSSFKKLRLISVQENKLGALQPDTFAGLENVLEKVNLEATDLEEFPTTSMEKLKKLEMLRLSKNSISELGAGALSGFQTTKNLDLYLMENKISEIDPEAFTGAGFILRKLQLDGNTISSLAFLDSIICSKMFSKNSHIYLMGCPLQCTCDTYSILSSEKVLVDGTCKSPDNVKDLDIRPDFIQKGKEICKDAKPKCSQAPHQRFSVSLSVAVTAVVVLFSV